MFAKYLLKRNMRYQGDLVDQLCNSSEKRLTRELHSIFAEMRHQEQDSRKFIESEPLCTVFRRGVSDSVSGSRKQFLRRNQTVYLHPTFLRQRRYGFRSYYARWQDYKRPNNREQVASMEERMRKVMADHNVPNDASYDDVVNMLNGND
jgi:hypothetical protein